MFSTPETLHPSRQPGLKEARRKCGSPRPWIIASLAFLQAFEPALTKADQDPAPLLNLSLKELSEVKVDTVYAASKFEQKVTDAPSSVSIVTHDQIQRFGYRTLADVVRSVRGFDVTYDRNYSYTGVRGFNSLGDYGSRTLLLVDGHRMNDPVYDTTAVGTDGFVDVDLIDRVEFIRGPGSAIYGSNAFFGVINVITRKGRDVNGVETSASGGSFDTYNGRITLGKRLDNGLEYLFSGTTYASQGQSRLFYREFNAPKTHHGIALNQDADQYWSALGKVSFGDFTLQGGYVTREKDVPTASYGTAFNEQNTSVDTRGYVELRHAHEFDSGWSVNTRLFYDTYYFHDLYTLDSASGLNLNSDASSAHWWGAETGVSRTFFDTLRLSLGVEFRRTSELYIRNFDERPYKSYLNAESEQKVIGAYADGRWEITKTLSLSTGLRWDWYDSFGSTVNPRAALVWKPLENTTLKLLYGNAFRAPNAYQLSYSALDQLANPNLQPEKIRSYEAVAEQYLGSHWRASISAFRNEISDLIDTREENGFVKFSNGGDAVVNGAEAEIEGKWDNGMLFRASYTRQNAVSDMTGEHLVNSPDDMIKAQVSVPLWNDKVSAGLELLYASSRTTMARKHTSDAWLINLTLLTKEIAPGLDFSVSLYNLLGQESSVPGGPEHRQDTIKQDGRTVRVKLTYRF